MSDRLKVVVATYFEHSCEATATLLHTPVYGLALDFVHGPDNFKSLEKIAASDKKLIAGIVDGRNIWINDITKSIDTLTQIATFIPRERLAAGTSCSLLHVPFTLRYETEMDPEIKSWLSYAIEKLEELHLISRIFFNGVEKLSPAEKSKLEANIETNLARRASTRIHDKAVLERIATLEKTERDMAFGERIALQHAALQYRPLATTTIGSFPQTPEIRKA